VHCIIPRGGESLIRFVVENSTIPVIKHFKGVCFVYVDHEADAGMAERIVVNAKVQRPGVCNAAEQLLVHAGVATTLLPAPGRRLARKKVELRCDPASAAILAGAASPTAPRRRPTHREFLDLIMAVRIVLSLDDAIATINRDGSAHSDAIVTRNPAAAQRFFAGVDSATVFWNASTRFSDGFEFGLGAEIGISTDRLHAAARWGCASSAPTNTSSPGTGQLRS